MKIGVIGAGSVAATAILALLADKDSQNLQVICISDPEIPINSVGESATSLILEGLTDGAHFRYLDDMEKIDGTMRWGTKYFWGLANGNEFTIHYPKPGIHLNSQKFGSFVIDVCQKRRDNFTYIEDLIVDIKKQSNSVIVEGKKESYKFDYVIDCRGVPPEEQLYSNDYMKPAFESVNSVILYSEPWDHKEEFTSATVHRNGWMFGVPLQSRKTFGYLYNKNFTSYEDALEDFSKLHKIDTSNVKGLSWNPYFKRTVFEDRVLTLGNKLYFFEPHNAMPLHFFYVITLNFVRSLQSSDSEINLASYLNINYRRSIEEMQDIICINYQGTNSLDSNFWKYAKEESFKRLSQSIPFRSWIRDYKLGNNFGFWTLEPEVMETYIKGYELDLDSFIDVDLL